MYADKSSGLERISIHGLRHTFSIRLIAKDVDIAKVAALLGHKSLQSAKLYNQIAPKHLDSAIALLDQDYGRNPLLGQALDLPDDPASHPSIEAIRWLRKNVASK